MLGKNNPMERMKQNWGGGGALKRETPPTTPGTAEVLIPADIAKLAIFGAASRADAEGYAAGVEDTHRAMAEQKPSLMKRIGQALTIPDNLLESERPAILRPRDPDTNPDMFDEAGKKLKESGKKAKIRIGEAWAESRRKRNEKKQTKKDKEAVS